MHMHACTSQFATSSPRPLPLPLPRSLPPSLRTLSCRQPSTACSRSSRTGARRSAGGMPWCRSLTASGSRCSGVWAGGGRASSDCTRVCVWGGGGQWGAPRWGSGMRGSGGVERLGWGSGGAGESQQHGSALPHQAGGDRGCVSTCSRTSGSDESGHSGAVAIWPRSSCDAARPKAVARWTRGCQPAVPMTPLRCPAA